VGLWEETYPKQNKASPPPPHSKSTTA
jgi:hypothetical protein